MFYNCTRLKKTAYEDDESIIGDRLTPKNLTIEASEALGDTFNVIDIWLKLLDNNYDAIREAYSTAMKEI